MNGISPSPQVELKFASQFEDPVNGNDLCNEVFKGKEGIRRYREFKTYFAAVDPMYVTPPRATHPNWKVDPVLKHAMVVCKEVMHMGKYISIDEQTIEFQGKHTDKIRVTYKNAGDGFQTDAFVLMVIPLIGIFGISPHHHITSIKNSLHCLQES